MKLTTETTHITPQTIIYNAIHHAMHTHYITQHDALTALTAHGMPPHMHHEIYTAWAERHHVTPNPMHPDPR